LKSNEDKLEFAIATLCSNVLDADVCRGAVTEMGDVIVPALTEGILDPDYFCSEFLGYCSSSNYYLFYSEDWVDTLLKSKPESLKDNNYLNNIYD
jgi:hypothetical protein